MCQARLLAITCTIDNTPSRRSLVQCIYDISLAVSSYCTCITVHNPGSMGLSKYGGVWLGKIYNSFRLKTGLMQRLVIVLPHCRGRTNFKENFTLFLDRRVKLLNKQTIINSKYALQVFDFLSSTKSMNIFGNKQKYKHCMCTCYLL